MPASLIAVPPDDPSLQSEHASDVRDTLRKSHKLVRDATTAGSEETYFDRRVKGYHHYVGQTVWLYWPKPLIRQQHRKLTRLWTGPWFSGPLLTYYAGFVPRSYWQTTGRACRPCRTVQL